MKPICCLIVVAICSCSAPSTGRLSGDFSPDNRSGDSPSSFDFNIKNGSGDTLILRYFFGKLFVMEKFQSVTKAFDLQPTAEEWTAFRRSVESVGIWEWSGGVDPGQPDFWSLNIYLDGHDLDINGTYFDRKGWNTFASSIETLIRRKSPIMEASKISGEQAGGGNGGL